jgi:anti-sigma factor RsiW
MSHISQTQLQAFLDGELSQEQRRRLSNHIAGCSSCEARMESMEALYGLIESLPEQRLEADLTPTILARLAPPTTLSSWARWLLLAELGLGVASLVAALGWLNWSIQSWSDLAWAALQSWVNTGDLALWLGSLWTPVQLGLDALGSLSDRAASPLSAALPVTGWAILLGALLLAGLAANGLILARAGQPRREEGRSA